MQQLSRPYQIALGALVVLAIAWFTVLKPSDEVATEPLPGAAAPAAAAVPGAAGLGRAVDKADAAVKTSAESAAATDAAGGDTPAVATTQVTAAPATGSTGTTGAVTAGADRRPRTDPSVKLLEDVADGKVVVVLFAGSTGSDDLEVRRALVAADRHGGRVVTRTVPIGDVAKYAAITEGVDVLQSPTLLVIGDGNLARSIVGFTDTRAIDQLVSDVGGRAFVPERR